MINIGRKWSKLVLHWNLVLKMNQKDQKLTKIDRKWPKLIENDQNWQKRVKKMAEYGLKLTKFGIGLEIWYRKLIGRTIIWPKLAEKWSKLAENGQNKQKMVKIGRKESKLEVNFQNWLKMVRNWPTLVLDLKCGTKNESKGPKIDQKLTKIGKKMVNFWYQVNPAKVAVNNGHELQSNCTDSRSQLVKLGLSPSH